MRYRLFLQSFISKKCFSGRMASARAGLLLCVLACGLLLPNAAWAKRFFSNESVWNRPIVNPVVMPDSASRVHASLSAGAAGARLYISMRDYSVPVYYVNGTTPRYDVAVSYPWPPYDVPGPNFGASIPIPDIAKPATGSDGHMVVVDLANRRCWDFYQARKTSSGWEATYGIGWDLDGTGTNPTWTAAARAAGTPLLAGLILFDEIKGGRIPHALAMSVPIIHGTQIFNPPASATQQGSSNPVTLAMGSHLQLDPALDIDALGLTRQAKVIARALQEFGAYIVDASQTNVIYAENLGPDDMRSWDGILSVTDLQAIPTEAFRVMEFSALDQSLATPEFVATLPTPAP